MRGFRIRSIVLAGLVVLSTLLVPFAEAPVEALGTCPALDASAVQFGHELTGSLANGTDGVCYTLPASSAGDTLQLSVVSTTSTALQVFLLASDDSQVCGFIVGSSACTVPATGTIRVQVRDEFSSAATYDVNLFPVTTNTGCPTAAESAFGVSAAGFSGSLTSGQADCRSINLTTGAHLVEEYGGATWTLYDTTGAVLCTGIDFVRCAVPASGTYTLVGVSAGGSVFDPPTTYQASVIDLLSPTGCTDPAPTNWASAPAHVSSSGILQVDCHTLNAAAGDRVAVAGQTLVYGYTAKTLVVDGSGADACVTADSSLGCTLQGTAPFRVISWDFPEAASGADHPDYDLVARSLEPGSGCPVLTPGAFGVAPSDAFPGIGCRQFDGTAQANMWVEAHDITGDDVVRGDELYGPDFSSLCDTRIGAIEVCQLPTTGRYTLISSLFTAKERTSLYNLGSSAGCAAQALNLSSRSTTTGFGQLDCSTLPASEVSGDTMWIAHSVGPAWPDPITSVVDSTGAIVCTDYGDTVPLSRCDLTGPGPYRAITANGTGTSDGVAFYRPGAVTCSAVPLGVSPGKTITLDATHRAVCLTATASSTQVVNLLRTSGTGSGEMAGLQGSTEICGTQGGAVGMYCYATGNYTIIVVGDGKPATFTVQRVVDNGKIQNFGPPHIVGPVRVDQTVSATPGAWSPAPLTFTFQWLLDGRPIAGATASTYRIPASARSRHLSVRVRAVPGTSIPSVVSTSTAMQVTTGSAPSAIHPATISGRHAVGRRLTVSLGTWSKRPTSYSFSWYVGGRLVRGDHARTLTLTRAMRHHTIKVVVTAHRTGCHNGQTVATTRF